MFLENKVFLFIKVFLSEASAVYDVSVVQCGVLMCQWFSAVCWCVSGLVQCADVSVV